MKLYFNNIWQDHHGHIMAMEQMKWGNALLLGFSLFKFKQPYAANSSILETVRLEYKFLKDTSSVSCSDSLIPWKSNQIWTAVLISNDNDYDTYNK